MKRAIAEKEYHIISWIECCECGYMSLTDMRKCPRCGVEFGYKWHNSPLSEKQRLEEEYVAWRMGDAEA